jgi:hypothetical protein
MKIFDYNSELAKQQFDRCLLVKVFFAARDRSAYHGRGSRTTVQAPDGSPLYSLSFGGIQRQIESRRRGGQGSAWRIFELPAIAFMARESTLVVYDLSGATMPSCIGSMPPSPLVSDVAQQLSARGDFILLFHVPNRQIAPAQLPLRDHKSFQSSRSQLLGWRSNPPIDDMASPLKIIARFIAKITVWRQSYKNATTD